MYIINAWRLVKCKCKSSGGGHCNCKKKKKNTETELVSVTLAFASATAEKGFNFGKQGYSCPLLKYLVKGCLLLNQTGSVLFWDSPRKNLPWFCLVAESVTFREKRQDLQLLLQPQVLIGQVSEGCGGKRAELGKLSVACFELLDLPQTRRERGAQNQSSTSNCRATWYRVFRGRQAQT